MLKSVVETSLDGICQVDAEGRFLFVSDSLAALLGYRPEELIGNHIGMVPSEGVLPEATRVVEQVLAGDHVEDELAVRHKDEHEIQVHFRAAPLWRSGRILGLSCTVRDVTERMQARLDLEAQERLLRALTEHSSDAVAVVDADGTTRYASPSLIRILGHRPEDRLGRSFLDNVHPEDRAPLIQQFSEVLQEPGSIVRAEVRAQHGDGTWRTIDSIGHNRLDDPAINGIVVNTRDVTERRQMEEALRRSETRFRSLFEDSPISLWEEDTSKIKEFVNRLESKQVCDYREYFDSHPEAVIGCASLMRIVDANRATLEIYEAETLDDFREGLSAVFTEESLRIFKEKLVSLANGETHLESEAVTQRSLARGCEST